MSFKALMDSKLTIVINEILMSFIVPVDGKLTNVHKPYGR